MPIKCSYLIKAGSTFTYQVTITAYKEFCILRDDYILLEEVSIQQIALIRTTSLIVYLVFHSGRVPRHVNFFNWTKRNECRTNCVLSQFKVNATNIYPERTNYSIYMKTLLCIYSKTACNQ